MSLARFSAVCNTGSSLFYKRHDIASTWMETKGSESYSCQSHTNIRGDGIMFSDIFVPTRHTVLHVEGSVCRCIFHSRIWCQLASFSPCDPRLRWRQNPFASWLRTGTFEAIRVVRRVAQTRETSEPYKIPPPLQVRGISTTLERSAQKSDYYCRRPDPSLSLTKTGNQIIVYSPDVVWAPACYR